RICREARCRRVIRREAVDVLYVSAQWKSFASSAICQKLPIALSRNARSSFRRSRASLNRCVANQPATSRKSPKNWLTGRLAALYRCIPKLRQPNPHRLRTELLATGAALTREYLHVRAPQMLLLGKKI